MSSGWQGYAGQVRIRPEEIVDAFGQSGFRPKRLVYLEPLAGEACALGALDFVHGEHESGDTPPYFTTRCDDVDMVAGAYRSGFVQGFDGHLRPPMPGVDAHPLDRGCAGWERWGWIDGLRAARAVGVARGEERDV